MKILKSLTAILLLCTMLLTFTSCAPSPRDEKQILADINVPDYLYEGFTAKSVVINDRQTDSKNGTDTVFVTTIIENYSDDIEGTLFLKLDYKLVDNGWVLSDYKTDESRQQDNVFRPVSKDDISQEEAIAYLEDTYGMDGVSITSFVTDTDLEMGIQNCRIELTDVHKYVTYKKSIILVREFLYALGEWDGIRIESSKIVEENWDVSGMYVADGKITYCDEYGKEIKYRNYEYETEFVGDSFDDITVSYRDVYTEYDMNDQMVRKNDDQQIESNKLTRIYNADKFQYTLATDVFDGCNYEGVRKGIKELTLAYMVSNQEYKVKLDKNENFRYFAHNDTFLYFFGDDFIGVCPYKSWAEDDVYNKAYVYTVLELVPQN